MDHRYIDEHSVAERYLEHTLQPPELTEFESHVVGCPECADRLLLAQIFLERRAMPHASGNGSPTDVHAHVDRIQDLSSSASRNDTELFGTWTRPGAQAIGSGSPANVTWTVRELPEPTLPWTARFVALFGPWQLLVILVVAAAMLLAIPTAYFLMELVRLRGTH